MRMKIVAFCVTVLFSQAAFAEHRMRPLSIVAEKASVITNATAHFGCELRSFTSTSVACYGPDAIRAAYGVKQLLANGIDGRGQTIVIIDAFGSPTAESDLGQFDALFGVPAPPSFKQIHMPGSTPFDYTDDNQIGWAQEVSLDIQWAHAIAPGAKIVVVAAVDNSDAAILDAQNYAISHKLGFIISESFGESEYALLQDGAEGRQILSDNEKSYRRARREHISVLVSSGDDGASTTDIDGNLVPFAAADYPASSPNVTSVGGTNLFFGTPDHADPNGTTRKKWSGTTASAQAVAASAGRSAFPTIRTTRCRVRSEVAQRDSAATLTWPTTPASRAACSSTSASSTRRLGRATTVSIFSAARAPALRSGRASPRWGINSADGRWASSTRASTISGGFARSVS